MKNEIESHIYKNRGECTIAFEKKPLRTDGNRIIRILLDDNKLVALISRSKGRTYCLYFFNDNNLEDKNQQGPFIYLNDDISYFFEEKPGTYRVRKIDVLRNCVFLTVEVNHLPF
jgi:hypothetical protein